MTLQPSRVISNVSELDDIVFHHRRTALRPHPVSTASDDRLAPTMSNNTNRYKLGTQKYWCERCKIFVTDNKPSRQMHENGGRHKAAVAEYLRDIEKRAETKRTEDAKTRDMLLRIERAATRQYAQDISGHKSQIVAPIRQSMYPRVGANAATCSASPQPLPKHLLPTIPPSASTYTGPIRLSGDDKPAELAPTADMGVAGAWTAVPVHQQVIPATRICNDGDDDVKPDMHEDVKQHEVVDEDEADADLDVKKSRQFRILEKTLGVGDSIITDDEINEDEGGLEENKNKRERESSTISHFITDMAARTITFVTGNANKLKEVQAILGGTNIVVTSAKLDLVEIQGTTQECAMDKARQASKALGGRPVLTEDTALCFNALNGLPGPYIKWFLESVGHHGLNKMLAAFDDKTAYALCTFALVPAPNAEPILFEGRNDGRIVDARGPPEFGWDPIFESADGSCGLTYAEMAKSVKNRISHRARALEKLKEFLSGLTTL
ncbi:hypothetical protein SeLEV6574_g08041 [Synchytrium endobioticum]|uniref:Inosine triphosphate pyrophosphatase n=1 Tax=Synchytrium endobioticum TaxID=286115 RepID=A0A507CEV4_9FUNG|nr:hypothetical protein SeLEV6574_g08041 [Synchytrium endobioticum]